MSEPTTVLSGLTSAAEERWLEGWTAGPAEEREVCLRAGDQAPDLALLDHTGESRQLSEFWTGGPALLMFWRHFGCGCGIDRAERLQAEWIQYQEAGLQPVIVAQGEPQRASVYRTEQGLPCPVLCDPDWTAYRAYGLGQWQVEKVLFDAPSEYWSHSREVGVAFQAARREGGRALVDDPWRAVAEFVIRPDGRIRLAYAYQHCEDFPDPRLLTTAARLS